VPAYAPYYTSTDPSCTPNNFTWTTNPYFTDVPSTDPYFKYIQRMGDLNAFYYASPVPFPGCGCATFGETTSIERGTLAMQLVAALALDPRVTLTFNSTIGPPTGPNYTATLPTITVPFNYYFQDKTYGANDVNYAQFGLMDSNGNYQCYGGWGRPNALELYYPGAVATYGLPTTQAESFCTVTLESITNSTSDPTAVTVLLGFTFNPGFAGTYTVMSQLNYLTGYGTPAFENIGTVTIQTPPPEYPAPTVTLVDNTQQSGIFVVGDYFTLTVAGQAGLPVSVIVGGVDSGALGTTTGGAYTIGPRQFTTSGNFTESWYVNGVAASPNPLSFSVLTSPPSATLTNTLFPGSPLFDVGQPYTYQITGPPNQTVVLSYSQSGSPGQVTFGQTDANGNYQYNGTWASSDVGDWFETWFIGSIQAVGQLVFSVGLTGCN